MDELLLDAGLPTFNGLPQDMLRMLAAPEALTSGNVNVISLDAIRDRLGDRWEKKREQIWDQAIKFLRRQFRSEDLIAQFGDAHILVIQPEREAFAAQAACVRAASELMRTFIGEASASALRIDTAEGFDPEDFVWVPLSPQKVESMLFAADPELPKPTRQGTFPVLTRMGRDLSVDLKLRPLWTFYPRQGIIGHYAHRYVSDAHTHAPIGRDERATLRPADLADIDIKLLSDALALRSESPALKGGLVAPISYLTLTNSSTRYQLQQLLNQLDPADKTSIVWEIVDLEPGIPAGRLDELVAMLRRQCRGVICRMPLTPDNAAKVRHAGATLSTHPECEVSYTEQGLLRLEGPLHQVLKTVPSVLLQELPPELLPVAKHVGETHFSFAVAA